jgi:hypothetical protein
MKKDNDFLIIPTNWEREQQPRRLSINEWVSIATLVSCILMAIGVETGVWSWVLSTAQ